MALCAVNGGQPAMPASTILRHPYLLVPKKKKKKKEAANQCWYPILGIGNIRNTVGGDMIHIYDNKTRIYNAFRTEWIGKANRLRIYFVESGATAARRLIDKMRRHG